MGWRKGWFLYVGLVSRYYLDLELSDVVILSLKLELNNLSCDILANSSRLIPFPNGWLDGFLGCWNVVVYVMYSLVWFGWISLAGQMLFAVANIDMTRVNKLFKMKCHWPIFPRLLPYHSRQMCSVFWWIWWNVDTKFTTCCVSCSDLTAHGN